MGYPIIRYSVTSTYIIMQKPRKISHTDVKIHCHDFYKYLNSRETLLNSKKLYCKYSKGSVSNVANWRRMVLVARVPTLQQRQFAPSQWELRRGTLIGLAVNCVGRRAPLNRHGRTGIRGSIRRSIMELRRADIIRVIRRFQPKWPCGECRSLLVVHRSKYNQLRSIIKSIRQGAHVVSTQFHRPVEMIKYSIISGGAASVREVFGINQRKRPDAIARVSDFPGH